MRQALAVHTLAEALTDSLRNLILTNEMEGGSQVTENDVANRFDVARPTAKAAIERLVSDGLLTRGSHKSARVPVLTPDAITDIYLARKCIEPVSVYRLAASGTVRPQAVAQNDLLRKVDETSTVVHMVECDIRFHRELLDGVGSQRLSRMHEALMGEMQLCMAQVQSNRLMRVAEIVEEHQLILDHIERGEPEAASKAVEAHLDSACAALLRHFDSPTSLAPARHRVEVYCAICQAFGIHLGAGNDQTFDRFYDIPDVDVHGRFDSATAVEPKCYESSIVEVSADDDPVVGAICRVTHVFHAKLILVSEEVGQLRVLLFAAQ